MKKNCFKGLALALVLILTSGLISGCLTQGTETGETGTTTPLQGKPVKLPAEEKATFKIWDSISANVTTITPSMTDTPLYKELEEQTNVRLEFIHPVGGKDTQAQFQTMIASGDYPDIFGMGMTSYTGGKQQAFEDEVIIDIAPYVAKGYMPNLKKILDTYPQLEKDIYTEQGQMLQVPVFKYTPTTAGLFLREDWLKELNLPVPETIEEWYTTLKAFKEQKGATAPFTEKIGMIRGEGDLLGAYGVGAGFYMEDEGGKKVMKYGPVEDGYKAYVKEMAKWYKEGLIDPEVLTLTDVMLDANVTSGKSGATQGYSSADMARYLNLMKQKDPNFDLIAAPDVVLEKGGENHFSPSGKIVQNASAYSVSAKCKDIPTVLAFLDYGYQYEGHMVYNFGIEGESYEMVDGQPKFTELITNNPKGTPMATILNIYAKSSSQGPMIQDKRYFEQYVTMPQQLDAIEVWGQNNKISDQANTVVLGTLTQQETDQVKNIQTDIGKYKELMFDKWLTGQEDIDATWDQYKAKINEIGLATWMQVRQTAHDRFIKKFPDAAKVDDFDIQEYIQTYKPKSK